ncbi:AIR synthase-related protein [Kitasatospora sp. NPDC048545]|uniref:AIR synthase-related protein n=1 Tax=Kitasatospora sp. NPDC048545 TaxID=3157208 RepID=UPI0033D7D611
MRHDHDRFTNRQITLDHDDDTGLGGELGAYVAELLGDTWAPEPADLPRDGSRLAVTSSSCTIDPPFFGDGDIGRVAACRAINDLAAAGAEPAWLTLGLTIEAGLPGSLLRRAVESARDAAREAGVRIVDVEARVVRAGEANRLFVHTTGFGVRLGPAQRMSDARPGDLVLLTSRLGGYAVHLLSVRQDLGLENVVPSGCAPLAELLASARAAAPPGAVRFVHRLARGGLAGALQAQASASRLTVRVVEAWIPVQHEIGAAAELLGLDPLYATDEGCLCLCVAADAAEDVLAALRSNRYGRYAQVVGEVTGIGSPAVVVAGADGQVRSTDVRAALWAEPPRLR